MGTGNSTELNSQPPVHTTPQEPISKDPDVKKCPTCSSVLHLVQDTDRQSSPVVQCLLCPTKPYLCRTCLFPWKGSTRAKEGCCANKRCAVVGTLLTCELINDLLSPVNGCPFFRACPECYCLLTHDKGCNYVTCLQCQHMFCYICLKNSGECLTGIQIRRHLTNSHQPAARQRFQM